MKSALSDRLSRAQNAVWLRSPLRGGGGGTAGRPGRCHCSVTGDAFAVGQIFWSAVAAQFLDGAAAAHARNFDQWPLLDGR